MKIIDNIKKKFKKKGELESLGDPVIEIRVKRFEAEDLPVEIMRFNAFQKSDGTTLQYISEDGNFRRDVTIAKNKLQESLIYKLNLNVFSKQDKIELIQEKIKAQEKTIKNIKDGYVEKEVIKKYNDIDGKELSKKVMEKVKVNNFDETNKLSHYKILLNEIKHGGRGSYVEMVNGKRVMHLQYEDGLYYPFKWVRSNSTVFADNGVKQKHYKSQAELIKEEYAEDMAGRGALQFQRILQVFSILLIISLLAFIFYTNVNRAESLDLEAQAGAERCKAFIQETGEDLCEGIILEKEKLRSQTEVENVTTNI